MAFNLPQENFSRTGANLVFGFFFVGLFLLALGVGLFLFDSWEDKESGGIEIINPSPTTPTAQAENTSTTGAVSINIGSKADLESLPAIGPVTAQKIIDLRPYSSIAELKSKKAVGASTFEKIKDLITL